jgi:hypothetical protein
VTRTFVNCSARSDFGGRARSPWLSADAIKSDIQYSRHFFFNSKTAIVSN